VPATELDNDHGHVRVAEFSSVPVGRGDTGERSVAVAQPDANTLLVALPDEVCAAAKRVLLVDDDAQLRAMISQLLEEAGIPHDCAASAGEAWEKLRADVPAVVVTDVEMPGLSGLDLCRRIKANPRTQFIPVLIMSGRPDYEAQAKAVGAADFIPKPIDFQQLAARLKEYLA
jgi:CheY-like chemotaxis protein